MPQFVWLACGGSQNLNFDRMAALKGRNVVLCPDVGCFDKWSLKAKEFETVCNLTVSDLIERKFPDRKNMDFADFLLTE